MLEDATLQPPAASGGGDGGHVTEGRPAALHNATLRVAGSEILYVHLPAAADTPELLRARLRALDQGRMQFRKRLRKQPKPKPIERFQPIEVDRVVEAHDDIL